MKVSIAISTYEANGKGVQLLSVNINSILQQDYENIEIVISDHSNNKDIYNYINNITPKSKYNIKYIHNPNDRGNISQNINNAIKNCSGDIIKIIFMDDFLFQKTAIREIVSLFRSKKIYWLVNSYLHTKDYKQYFNMIYPRYTEKIINGVNTIGCPSGLTISKEVTEEFDINLKWFMDCEYYYRLFCIYGSPDVYIDKPLICTLLHTSQVTNDCVNNNTLIENEKKYINNKHNTNI
tara:strand:+ start:547 stop:1257 length:711 start_codon:yes stop_codon:yes gene_type:complete